MTSIFFPGDTVTVTHGGQQATGVIESFAYDLPALYRGEPDTASVRLPDGALVPVSVAELVPS